MGIRDRIPSAEGIAGFLMSFAGIGLLFAYRWWAGLIGVAAFVGFWYVALFVFTPFIPQDFERNDDEVSSAPP
jgi:hypothetical protein